MVRTLKKEVQTYGIGLHTGKKVNIRILPYNRAGIIFKRIDLKGSPKIKADAQYVVSSDNQTVLKRGNIKVSTVEHLLATLHCLRINAAMIELNGEEIPSGDGSAKIWVDLIKKTGIAVLPNLSKVGRPFKVASIKKPIIVGDQQRFLLALPSSKFKVTYLLSHPQIGQQFVHFTITPKVFCQELALARTFSTYEEAISLRRCGMALGGSLNNAVIIKDKKALIPLRYPDEFARHKVLDLIGDLALTNTILKIHLIGIRSGHRLNHLLLRKII